MKRTNTYDRDISAPTLRELQDELQAAILAGDDTILNFIPDNSRTSREILFGVYRNAYTWRLVDILSNDYPLTRRYVGDDFFNAFAQHYISAHPSKTQNARWFGSRFPAFLKTYPSAAVKPEIAEIAEIEKLVSDAFDSTDAPALALSGLIEFQPEDWSRLTFRPHQSSATLSADTNAFALWKALKDDEEPPVSEMLPVAETVVIWRQDVTPRVRVLTYEEAMMWKEAGCGTTFGVLCELLATFDEPDGAAVRAAGYLQNWLMSGMLTSAKLAEREQRIEASPDTAF